MRYHKCPGCAEAEVPETMLACLPCWRRLPEPVKAEVSATRRLPLTDPRRRNALLAAMNEFRKA